MFVPKCAFMYVCRTVCVCEHGCVEEDANAS